MHDIVRERRRGERGEQSIDSQRSRTLAVATRMRFPKIHSGMTNRLNKPMNMPKIPKGSAAPLLSIQSVMKKVQAKAMMERRMVTMTKQSPAR